MNKPVDPFDIENLCLPSGLVEKLATAKPKASKWKRHYTIFPYAWQERLRDCQAGSTYRVAVYLVYEHWRNEGRRIRLSNGVMAAEGVSPTAKLRGLRALESAGLVKVDWRSRKAPVVTCLLMEGIPTRQATAPNSAK